ncbi:MAG: hypothetical protein VB875_05595, partial [Pirellulales bacterium]
SWFSPLENSILPSLNETYTLILMSERPFVDICPGNTPGRDRVGNRITKWFSIFIRDQPRLVGRGDSTERPAVPKMMLPQFVRREIVFNLSWTPL